MKLRFQLPRTNLKNPFRRNRTTRHDTPFGTIRTTHPTSTHPTFDLSHLPPPKHQRRTIKKAQRKAQRAARRRHSCLINHRRHSR